MTGSRRLAWAASVLVALFGLVVLAPGAAAAEDSYNVDIDGSKAAFLFQICLKTTTTVREWKSKDGDRVCSGKKGSPNGKFSLSAKYTDGDTVWVDINMFTDLTGGSRDVDNVEITGSHSCKLWGALYAGKFKCDLVSRNIEFTPPEIPEYKPTLGAGQPVTGLLNLMAWCVSAAAVAGLIIIGMTMASRIRSGVFAERSEYLRQFITVLIACLIAATAGPIIEWLKIP